MQLARSSQDQAEIVRRNTLHVVENPAMRAKDDPEISQDQSCRSPDENPASEPLEASTFAGGVCAFDRRHGRVCLYVAVSICARKRKRQCWQTRRELTDNGERDLPTHVRLANIAAADPTADGRLGVIALALVAGAFQLGRQSAIAKAIQAGASELQHEPASFSPERKPEQPKDFSKVRIENIATVPFSELYDVLRSAEREQILTWARDLEKMPRGPRQIGAVIAFYKSLIQVDTATAIDAILQAQNMGMRDVAIDALMKAAPESIWGDLAEMMARLPHPRRGATGEDVIWNWSRVDPVAASQFIESHPAKEKEDDRLFSLLCNWGEIDPAAALRWLEADASRQTEDSFRAFMSGWVDANREAALDFLVANSGRPKFGASVMDATYGVFLQSPDDARALILRLPSDHASSVVAHVAHTTAGVILGMPESYQKPMGEVASWMLTLPPALWRENIGELFGTWARRDMDHASAWVNALSPETRDAVLANFCRHPSDETREQAVTLGLTINDSRVRNQVLGEFARGLGETRAEAMDALRRLAISDEARNFLSRMIPK